VYAFWRLTDKDRQRQTDEQTDGQNQCVKALLLIKVCARVIQTVESNSWQTRSIARPLSDSWVSCCCCL